MEEIKRALSAKLKPKKRAKKRKASSEPEKVEESNSAPDPEVKKKRRERLKKKKLKKRKKAQAAAAGAAGKKKGVQEDTPKSKADKSKRTVTIALPGSIVDNCQSRELQSYVAGWFHQFNAHA